MKLQKSNDHKVVQYRSPDELFKLIFPHYFHFFLAHFAATTNWVNEWLTMS
jgi:hypothetical protein